MSTATSIKRSELYRLVWHEPMTRLAKRFGLSDVGLAKICRKHNIPSPHRGYWAKKQHGQEPSKIPLPELDSDDDIDMRDPGELSGSTSDLREVTDVLVAIEKEPERRIRVAESLRGAHDLVSRANQDLKLAGTDRDGFIARGEKPQLDVSVSKRSLRRALLLMDALLKALEERGYTVAVGPAVSILGAVVRFGISEQIATTREAYEEEDLEGPYSFHHNRFKEKSAPSGRLTLEIHHAYWSHGCRHTWRDTDTKKLEECLNQFIAGLVKVAACAKEHEDKQRRAMELRREEEAHRQTAARELAEKRERYKAEKARFDFLLLQAENWQKSKLVRELIEAARTSHSAAGPIELGSKIDVWLKWAAEQADRLDPLTVSPPSILDEDLGAIEEQQHGYRRT